MENRLYERDKAEFERQAKAHAAAASRAVNANSLIPPFGLILVIGVISVAIAWATGAFVRNIEPDRYMAARNLWLADCQKPIEACAADWDNGYTLREIYGEKVPLK